MSEFLSLPLTPPQGQDELLIVREGETYRGKVNGLPSNSQGPVSIAPPETGLIWHQIDDSGNLIELWQRSPDGQLWLSQTVWQVGYYYQPSTIKKWEGGNPVPAASVWWESLLISGSADSAFEPDETREIEFNLIQVDNNRIEEKPWFSYSLQGLGDNEFVNVVESINLKKPKTKGFGIVIRDRSSGVPRLKFASVYLTLRKVYEPEI